MKRGTTVRQVMPKPFEGVVVGFAVDQESGKSQAEVKAEDGTSRFFDLDQLEQVEQEPAEG